ncbi:MAG: flippase [Coriobacteriia bacterium]|nr:flippase [Coriobacteriia bacterium]
MLKDILKGAGTDALTYFPVRLVPALTALITVPVFTRLITKADYGDFALVTSSVSLIALIATAWINGSIVRFYWSYDREGRRDDFIGSTVWALTLTLGLASVLALGAGYLFADILPGSLARLLPIGAASLAINTFMTSSLQVFRAANKARTYAVLSVGTTLAATGLSIFFVTVPRLGSFGILLGAVLGHLILLPFNLRQLRKEGSLRPRHLRPDVVSNFASYGLPLVPAAISSWLLVLADRYIIGFLQTAEEVGLYSVAYGLGDKIMQLIVLPLAITMGPVMIKTFEQQGQELAEKVQTQFTRYFSMATMPLLFGIAAVARHFMGVFTGAEFREAYPILAIVATAAMLNGMVQIAGTGVALHRRTTITMTNTVAAAGFNIIGNLILVPIYGYMAAAYTTVASYLLLLALTYFRSRPYMAWRIPWADMARIVGASALMAAVIVIAFGGRDASVTILLIEVTVGLIVYVLALLGLGALKQDERAFLGRLTRSGLDKIRRAGR